MDLKILFKTNSVGRRIYVIKLAITPINLEKRLIITVKLTGPPREDAKLHISPSTNDLTNINLVDDVNFKFTNTELSVDNLSEDYNDYLQRIVRDRDIKQVLSNIFNQILGYKYNHIWDYNVMENFELLDSTLSGIFMFDGKYYYSSIIADPSNPYGGRIKITDYKWIS